MEDFLGKELKEGDFIVYAQRDGNTSRLTLFKLTKVTGDLFKGRAMVYSLYSKMWNVLKEVTLTKTQNAVILPLSEIPQEVQDRYELLTSNNPTL